MSEPCSIKMPRSPPIEIESYHRIVISGAEPKVGGNGGVRVQ